MRPSPSPCGSHARAISGRFASVQIGWDLGLTTGLVYVAGGVASGFTFLYGARF